jgi:hypothetical protein
MDAHPAWVGRLDRVENRLAELVRLRTAKEFYTTAEIAALLGKAEFTVREWCRHGRVHCQKKLNGRGRSSSWAFSRRAFADPAGRATAADDRFHKGLVA